MPNAERQYQLIAVSRDSDTGLTKIESYRRLSDEEYREYVESIDRLLELRSFNQTLGAVAAAHADLAGDWERVLASAESLQGNANRAEEVKARLNIRLSAFLSSAKAFLDHTQTRLTRTYGRENAIFRAFVRATNVEYDNAPAYRICSKLRNFIQHCGMPIRFVGVHGWIENPPDGLRRQRVRVSCTAKDLLDRFDDWGIAAVDLRAIEGDVPVLALSEQFLRSLTRVYEVVLELEVPQYVQAGQRVVRLLNEVMEPGKSGTVAEVGRHERGHQNISFVEPPMDILQLMGMAVADEPG